MKSNQPGFIDSDTRLHFADHLRTSLVVLVVIHHIALVYSGAAPFYYVEPPPITEFKAIRGLLIFVLANQSFFMGALFLLAGYFTPGAYERRGARPFVRDKILRYGIPLIIYVFVLNPISELGVYLMPGNITGIIGGPAWSDYPELIGIGPLWFVAMLLIFQGGYALLRIVRGNAQSKLFQNKIPGLLGAAVFAVLIAVTSYLFRMLVPLGKSVAGFPTLAYLPQYAGFYVIGVLAFRRNWLRTIRASLGIVGAVTAAAVSVFLLPLAFSGRMFSFSLTPSLVKAFGEGHWRSAVYAAWDSLFSVGLVLGLLVLFRGAANRSSSIGSFGSRQSYGVYIIHIPVVIYGCYLLRVIDLATVPKFLFASVILVPVCFLVAYVIRKIPGVSKLI